jgi:hypothetical protein
MQPLLQLESNKFYMLSVFACSLGYLACNAHAPYCHVWPTPLCGIFPRYLVNGIKKKKLLNVKCVF